MLSLPLVNTSLDCVPSSTIRLFLCFTGKDFTNRSFRFNLTSLISKEPHGGRQQCFQLAGYLPIVFKIIVRELETNVKRKNYIDPPKIRFQINKSLLSKPNT